MTDKISISNFSFKLFHYGGYKVIFTSNHGKVTLSAIITDMPLIDLTKNADTPKRCNLLRLKKMIKYKTL